jgi:hypothetical protein
MANRRERESGRLERRSGQPNKGFGDKFNRDPKGSSEQLGETGDATSDKIYGLIPVLEVLRAGRRALESVTIAEGARHDRLSELLHLAKQARVPVIEFQELVSTGWMATLTIRVWLREWPRRATATLMICWTLWRRRSNRNRNLW